MSDKGINMVRLTVAQAVTIQYALDVYGKDNILPSIWRNNVFMHVCFNPPSGETFNIVPAPTREVDVLVSKGDCGMTFYPQTKRADEFLRGRFFMNDDGACDFRTNGPVVCGDLIAEGFTIGPC
jgi:hypothetical protein